MLHLVDEFSQALNPLLAVVLVAMAFVTLRRAAPLWIGKVALAVLVVQQGAKFVQKLHLVDTRFPSTHFAFALAIAGGFCALQRRFVAPLLAWCALYGAFILAREFHTPLDLIGALPALPLVWLVGRWGHKQPVAVKVNDPAPIASVEPSGRSV